jgi:archaellum biogenesis ATPase FlaH
MKLDVKDEFQQQYNADVQKIFLSILIADTDLFAKCRTIIQDVYFDDQFRPLVRYLVSHSDTYRAVPTLEMITAKTGITLTAFTSEQIKLQKQWFCDDFEGFCRYRAMENIILEGVDLLRAGKAEEVSARVKDALTIRLMSDLGTDYFEDPETRLRRLLDKSATISTGWKTVDDKLFGGFTRGGLNLLLANSGVGKSLALQNLALNWVLAGFNGIYFSLELGEDHIALKMDAMLTGRGTRDIIRQLSDSALLVKMQGKKAGRLHIKRFPEGGTTVNDLRAYLKEYEIINGSKPDFLLIDYLDLVHPNDKRVDLSNLHIKDKFVSEEIRGLMHETDTWGCSASQLTRCLSPETIVYEKLKGEIQLINVKKGDMLRGSNDFVEVKEVFKTVKKQAYKIKTKSGKMIVCSSNHRFPTKRGILAIDTGLAIGDVLTISTAS